MKDSREAGAENSVHLCTIVIDDVTRLSYWRHRFGLHYIPHSLSLPSSDPGRIGRKRCHLRIFLRKNSAV
jgi:hypothetical protein